MARSFKLPDLGEGIHEGEVIAVLVKVGDAVEEGDPILEVETDKASVEIPSPFTGTVKEIMVKAGDVVKVGNLMMTFSDDAAGVKKEKPGQEPDKEQAAKKIEKAPSEKKIKPAEPAGEATPQQEEDQTAGTQERNKGPVPASPATRRLARELGIDLRVVTPSGPAGMVTAEDVRAFASKETRGKGAEEEPSAGAEPFVVAGEGSPDCRTFRSGGPWNGCRCDHPKGNRPANDAGLVPDSACFQPGRYRCHPARSFASPEQTGCRNTGWPAHSDRICHKGCAAALKQFPQFNVSLDVAKGEIVRKHYRHVGVATDTGEGLVVPVLRNAD